MEYLLLFGLLCILDCLYFKYKYTTPNGPPVWTGFPFVGMTPIILLPKCLYIPLLQWFFKTAPDVLILRHFKAFVLVKRSLVKELELDGSTVSRDSSPFMDLISYATNGKIAWTLFDAARPNLDWRTIRKNNLAAIYGISKRQLFTRISDVVDSFLVTIRDHEKRLWDFENDLLFNKIQESGNIYIGKTFKSNTIQGFLDLVMLQSRAATVLVLLSFVLPLRLMLFISNLRRGLFKLCSMGSIYGKMLRRFADTAPESVKEPKHFVEAAAMRLEEPDDLFHFLREVTFFNVFATTITTLHSISMALVQLALNPAIQRKASREIESVAKSSHLNVDHLGELHYLKAVVHESFRISPPITYAFRRTTKQFDLGGYDIPANMSVLLILLSEAWDEEHFADPLTFEPGRFLDGDGVFKNDDHFSVFSRGKRACAGRDLGVMSTSVYVAKILQQFEIQIDPKHRNIVAHDGGILPANMRIPLRFVRRVGAPEIEAVPLNTDLTTIINEVLDDEMKCVSQIK